MRQVNIGVVVIGRNEGDRLRACLDSLSTVDARVYVDSGSIDGSSELARSLGVEVVDLDPAVPFTAARARNTGIERLLERHPDLELVQTVDGDCAVQPDWLATAAQDIAADPRRAVVFGRRRERHANLNAYHRACDDEWDVPLGAVNSCGGDALFRISALREVGGYNGALIAGEEPDLCLRLKQRGWHIWSNGAEMTVHDVAMTRLAQWWHRARRTGFALSELVRLHGAAADPGWRRLLGSALGWTAIMVCAVPGLIAFVLHNGLTFRLLALLPFALSAIQIARLTGSKRARFGTYRALQWALLIMVAKVAQSVGWLQHKLRRRDGTQTRLIEYKA